MPNIDLEVWVAAPAEKVFDLARSVEVHTASMAGSTERIVAGVTEGGMELGQDVTWEARHFGRTFRLTSRIVEFDRPLRFMDQQVAGPFESWRHVHLFETQRGGTRMIDCIDYEAPLGILGRVAERLFLHSYLVRLIRQRNDYIKYLAESS